MITYHKVSILIDFDLGKWKFFNKRRSHRPHLIKIVLFVSSTQYEITSGLYFDTYSCNQVSRLDLTLNKHLFEEIIN